jgi:hypothetical protein
MPAGNIMLSAAILYSGSIPAVALRMLKHYKCVSISRTTFFEHQRTILHPAILNVWTKHQAKFIDELKAAGKPLVVGGDGRCDSPGHCAKFGSYSMLDLDQGKVLDLQLVQVTIFCIIMLTVFTITRLSEHTYISVTITFL